MSASFMIGDTVFALLCALLYILTLTHRQNEKDHLSYEDFMKSPNHPEKAKDKTNENA